MAIESTYVVLDTDVATRDMINESIQSESSIKTSLDGTKLILKFNTKFPNTLSGHTKYTYLEILEFLDNNSADWEGEIFE